MWSHCILLIVIEENENFLIIVWDLFLDQNGLQFDVRVNEEKNFKIARPNF